MTEADLTVVDSGPAIPIVELAGSPEEIGLAHGRRLPEGIRRLRSALEDYIFNARPRAQAVAFKQATRRLHRSTAPRHRRELAAIAKGAEAPLDDILMLNYFDDALNILQQLGSKAGLGCSVAVLGEGRELIHVRCLDYFFPPDFTPFGAEAARELRALQTIFVIRGDGVQPFLSVAWPGYAGAVTGWNEAGISLGALTSYMPAGRPSGVASGLLYRQLLEVGRSITDFVTLIDRLGCAIGNNLVLVDGAGGEYVALEIAPRRPVVRRESPYDRRVTNHFVTPELAARQEGLAPEHSYVRQDRLVELTREVENGAARSILLDTKPLGGGDHGVIDNPGTVQGVIFDHRDFSLSVRTWDESGCSRFVDYGPGLRPV